MISTQLLPRLSPSSPRPRALRSGLSALGLCCLGMSSPLAAAPGEPTEPPPPRTPPAELPADVPDILKQMVGCFKVTFAFVEDGARDQFFAPVYERTVLSREEPLTIKRTLVVENLEIPHWSEEWTQVDGRTWHQRVIGPAGDFRYECDGTWERNQWSCVAKGAAKPRRDAGEDYANLDRTITLQLTSKRWIQSENNRKLTASGDLYSVELGWNRYERADAALCQKAR